MHEAVRGYFETGVVEILHLIPGHIPITLTQKTRVYVECRVLPHGFQHLCWSFILRGIAVIKRQCNCASACSMRDCPAQKKEESHGRGHGSQDGRADAWTPGPAPCRI